MPIKLDANVINKDTISSLLATEGNCTHPSGHCYGSDGGSGIPENLKVLKGRGGTFEVWTLNAQKTQVLLKEWFSKCQFCGRYYYAGEKTG